MCHVILRNLPKISRRWSSHRRGLRVEDVLQRESPQRPIQSGRCPEPAAQRGRPHHHDRQGGTWLWPGALVQSYYGNKTFDWTLVLSFRRERARLVSMNSVTQSTRTAGPWAARTGPCWTPSKKSAPWRIASICPGTSLYVRLSVLAGHAWRFQLNYRAAGLFSP